LILALRSRFCQTASPAAANAITASSAEEIGVPSTRQYSDGLIVLEFPRAKARGPESWCLAVVYLL